MCLLWWKVTKRHLSLKQMEDILGDTLQIMTIGNDFQNFFGACSHNLWRFRIEKAI